MVFNLRNYRNTTELENINGVPIYMHDMVDASLRGKLNLFLQGDTGSGKTQIVRDVMADYFGDKSLFILGSNDMDTRQLFQRVNPEFLKAMREGTSAGDVRFKELTDKINYHFIGVDELPNCVPAVRAQLFNLFDGFIEIDGVPYPIGAGYCVGMATGNIGQQFTESSNELGRAIRDRMHINIDTDFFRRQPIDHHEMLAADRNPRVHFGGTLEDRIGEIVESHRKLSEREIPYEKFIIADYLMHGLDYVNEFGSKTAMKSGWPNKLEGRHAAGGDEALILPVSPRAAKAIITLSQALDQITQEKGAAGQDSMASMMQAFKFVGAYSGILNVALLRQTYDENPYKAMDAVISVTESQFSEAMREKISAAIEMAGKGKKNKKLMDEFKGRWGFMRNIAEHLAEQNETSR